MRRWAARGLALVVAACSGPGAGDSPGAGAPSTQAPPLLADGWRAWVSGDETRLDALLDASPGWKALFAQRPFEAATAFRDGAKGGQMSAADRVGRTRALLAAADALEQAADVLTLAQRPLVAQLAAATPPVPGAAAWRDYLEAGPGATAPVSAGPAPYAGPTTHLQPPPVPDQAEADERTPIYDPGPARAEAQALRLEAVATACPTPADTASKLACGLARAATGDAAGAGASLREALAAPDWTPAALLPVLVFDWLDTPAELRALAGGVAATGDAPSAATPPVEAAAWRAGCRLAPAGRDCAAGLTLASVDAALRAERRTSSEAIEARPPEARALLRTLDAVEARARGWAASDARVLLAAGRPVDAFALCTSGGAPAGAEAPGRDAVPVLLAVHAALARAAVETENAQLAFQSSGELAPQSPAWAAARDAVRLFGLGLVARSGGRAGAVGGAKPE
jgi:hypothetical protein